MTQDYYEQITRLMNLEACAIESAARRMSKRDAERAVEVLINCRGKVVVMGVGKSGVIAQKIAQTLTSVGLAAIFLHPSDALHGGLGIIADGDVVIILSNSGETDELVVLLPSLKRRRAPLIAIVGNMGATIARHCDIALDASVEREACPLDLAPTASTTVALAIGDALAMTWSAARGVSREDFAVNHPAGQLGKRLTVTVGDLMHADAGHPFIALEAAWIEAIAMISRGGLGAVNVVDGNQKLVGIITDGDVRRAIEAGKITSHTDLRARDIMTHAPVSITADRLAYDALRLMEDRPSQISVLPVVDDAGCAIAILRLHDIVRSGL